MTGARTESGRVRGARRAAARPLALGWAALRGTGPAFGLLVLVGVFVAVAGPRASLDLRTRALQQTLAQLPAADRSLVAQTQIVTFPNAAGPANLRADRTAIGKVLTDQSLPLAPGTAWAGVTAPYGQVSGAGRRAVNGAIKPQLELLYRDPLSRNARVVAGRFPRAGSVHTSGSLVTSATFEVAVTEPIAARFGLRPGSRLTLAGPDQSVTLIVTGILRPIDPRSAFWTLDPDAAAPYLSPSSPRTPPPYWTAGAFVGTSEVSALEHVFVSKGLMVTWDYPMAIGAVNADQVPALNADLTAATNGSLLRIVHGNLSVTSGLYTSLPAFLSTSTATQSLLTLVLISLVVLSAVAVLLGARLLAGHREAECALIRSRGGSLWQVAAYAMATDAMAVVPAAIAGAVIAVLVTPGPDTSSAWEFAVLVAVTALVGPPLVLAGRQIGGRAASRRASRHLARRRLIRALVADATVAAIAVAGLVILRVQGIPKAGAPNLYVSAAPALAAAPVALLAARVVPGALRAALHWAARARGVTVLTGLAGAVRAAAAAALPIFGLVLALAVAAFGGMTRAAIDRGQQTASWLSTGADAVVTQADANAAIGPSLAHAIASLPGVRQTAAVVTVSGLTNAESPVQIIAVDPARYAALTAATPFPPFPARRLPAAPVPGEPIPAIASPGALALLGHRPARLSTSDRTLTVRVAGALTATPADPAGGAFVIIPAAAAPRGWAPDMLLVNGSVNGSALTALVRHALPGGVVTLRSTALAALSGAPLPHSAVTAFTLGTVTAAGLSALILVLSLTLSARAREQTMARLATMGLLPGQATLLAVVEATPVLVAALAGGIGCALALVPLTGPVLDLTPFTGTGVRNTVLASPSALLAAAAGLAVLAAATLAGQAMIAHRRGPAAALRAGG